LLFNIEPSTDVVRSIGCARGAGGDSIGDVVANVGEIIISEGVKEHDGEEVVFLGQPNSVDTPDEVRELHTRGGETFGTTEMHGERLLDQKDLCDGPHLLMTSFQLSPSSICVGEGA
jgi:hypothetical protein